MACKMCSMCGGPTQQPNFQKLVDPYPRNYDTILGSEPRNCARLNPCAGNLGPPIQLCLPAVYSCPASNQGRHNPGQQPCVVNVPRDCPKPCPQIICEPCPPQPPTKVWLIKSSPMPQKVGLSSLLLFLLSCCIPIGGGPSCSGYNSSQAKIMLCLPCSPQLTETNPQKKVCGINTCGNKKNVGKYLPPPAKRICPPHCIHRSDLKGGRPCTWYEGIPCIAHCFETPNDPNSKC
ncbi:hypothetical protein Phum_PHUM140830 [Pediculus humanus corporis]|uniref:Uncharacterized protein n=1 Tax=Pediculus humanus subsp. corporis TaxID=121224 RepID=E0VEV1_PEDHC|nr:uncharacterized protein Phum_PHUM140830 [Pediculus humanus corporis]EEB11907.1 hypothetical protein Phum_PHUM140830 [Pediculus humanus corporis]